MNNEVVFLNSLPDICKKCLVAPCCSTRCRNYAICVYESKEYALAGASVENSIKDMPYEEAIQHILMVENAYLQIFKSHRLKPGDKRKVKNDVVSHNSSRSNL